MREKKWQLCLLECYAVLVLGWMDDDARRPRPMGECGVLATSSRFRHCHMLLALSVVFLFPCHRQVILERGA
jgi:hypothetical protein